jgi:hypothetical protein
MRCGAVNAACDFTAARAVRHWAALQLFTFVESFRNARVENGRLRQLELKKVQAATHNGRCAARCMQFPACHGAAYTRREAMLHVSVSEPRCGTARRRRTEGLLVRRRLRLDCLGKPD